MKMARKPEPPFPSQCSSSLTFLNGFPILPRSRGPRESNMSAKSSKKTNVRQGIRPIFLEEGADALPPYEAYGGADTAPPEVSIVIPVYNEEGILRESVTDLVASMKQFAFTYEIVLAENGSKDDTVKIGKELEGEFPQVRMMHNEEPDYGLALRRGILSSRAEFILCDEIDICDPSFYVQALTELFPGHAEMVVGSKCLDSSKDKRPAFRRFSTFTINFLLRVFLGFKGTDTHGLKAFKRQPLIDMVNACVVNRDLFASEFVIRTERSQFRVMEVPIEIEEKRAPSINLVRRVPHVLKNLAQLVWYIRVK